MLTQVATVINNDVEAAIFVRQTKKGFRIGLVALTDVDPMFAKLSFIAEINSNDLAVAEVSLPHAKRLTTVVRVFIATDANFKELELLVPQWLEVALIVLGVPVHLPFISMKDTGELIEIVSIKIRRKTPCGVAEATTGRRWEPLLQRFSQTHR